MAKQLNGAPTERLNLTLDGTINGEPADKELPFGTYVVADLSLGTSRDCDFDLEERKSRVLDGTNTNEVMRDMGIRLNIVVPNKINPKEEGLRVHLSLDSMNSFSPEQIAKQIPQVRSLLLLKKLLEEVQSNIANKKEFTNLLNRLLAGGGIGKMREVLSSYSNYQIPQANTNAEDNTARSSS